MGTQVDAAPEVALDAGALTGSDRRSGGIQPGLLRPFAFGLVASAVLAGFYLGTIALAQSWEHAFAQLRADLPFVGVLTLGFGLQVGLFTYLRGLAAQARKAGVAASAGTGGVAMLACCAHHLTDVLPVVGLSAAAAFLGAYKTPLLWLGVATNLAGMAYLVWQVRKAARFRRVISID